MCLLYQWSDIEFEKSPVLRPIDTQKKNRNKIKKSFSSRCIIKKYYFFF